MQQRPRKPGDQAPPFRPTHRNPGKTASTHVKDTSGLFFVHAGNGETVIDPATGSAFEKLTYDDARRAKDYAVTKLKMRQAGVRPMPEDSAEAEASDGSPTGDSFNKPSEDPVVEANRQKAVAAARGTAAAAQDRHEKLKAARAMPQVQRPGNDPRAPKTPIVGLDPIPGEDDDLEIDENAIGDIDVSDLLKGGDLPGDDIARARAQAAEDVAKIDAAGKAHYVKKMTTEGKAPNVPTWDQLNDKERAVYRWEAMNPPTYAPKIGDVVAFFGEHGEDGACKSYAAQVTQARGATVLCLQVEIDGEVREIENVVRFTGDGQVPNSWRPIE